MLKKVVIFLNFIILNSVYSLENNSEYPLDYYQHISFESKKNEIMKRQKENTNTVNNEDLISLVEREERNYLVKRDISGEKIEKIEIDIEKYEQSNK